MFIFETLFFSPKGTPINVMATKNTFYIFFNIYNLVERKNASHCQSKSKFNIRYKS